MSPSWRTAGEAGRGRGLLDRLPVGSVSGLVRARMKRSWRTKSVRT